MCYEDGRDNKQKQNFCEETFTWNTKNETESSVTFRHANLQALRKHEQLNCVNIPRLAKAIAWNGMPSLLP
jgi:hypothetical protein